MFDKQKWPLIRRRGGGWSDSDDCEHNIGPWFKSPPGYIVLANLDNFQVAALLAISTYIKSKIYDFRTVTYNIPHLTFEK